MELLIKELQQFEGIQPVLKGRFPLSPALAPTFQLYMTSMIENEYKLLARSGNKVQEWAMMPREPLVEELLLVLPHCLLTPQLHLPCGDERNHKIISLMYLLKDSGRTTATILERNQNRKGVENKEDKYMKEKRKEIQCKVALILLNYFTHVPARPSAREPDRPWLKGKVPDENSQMAARPSLFLCIG
ncbi:hypothetical protein Vadar_020409 [Vaccinium darrowii]|uniref:Uncharacterized protein n=1 Tax=Vaccinium darrowii TaxID=229202 RepID=A0ACB7XIU4_9ERIC|nr:hypothetical protein Vadar_020409 [Vaccinium darrowii]